MANTIHAILFQRRLPVDPRHNSKIERPRLGGILPRMRPSEVERHPAGYLWSQRFPDHDQVLLVEGGAVYAARGEDAWWVIIDEGTLAGFLDDEGGLDTLITLERFDDEAAWLARIAHFRPVGRPEPH